MQKRPNDGLHSTEPDLQGAIVRALVSADLGTRRHPADPDPNRVPGSPVGGGPRHRTDLKVRSEDPTQVPTHVATVGYDSETDIAVIAIGNRPRPRHRRGAADAPLVIQIGAVRAEYSPGCFALAVPEAAKTFESPDYPMTVFPFTALASAEVVAMAKDAITSSGNQHYPTPGYGHVLYLDDAQLDTLEAAWQSLFPNLQLTDLPPASEQRELG